MPPRGHNTLLSDDLYIIEGFFDCSPNTTKIAECFSRETLESRVPSAAPLDSAPSVSIVIPSGSLNARADAVRLCGCYILTYSGTPTCGHLLNYRILLQNYCLFS